MNKETEFEIENAGLVLVVPFLPRFFKNLGFLDVMRFLNHDVHAKAIHLLEYMATGNTTTNKNLSLNALLCGWPIKQPIPSSVSLSDIEKQQADQILEAMLAHWSALGNMTIDDLREKFICRKGILKIELASSLTVSPRPHDHLLKEFPWIYTLIRTPWSEQIEVHWNN